MQIRNILRCFLNPSFPLENLNVQRVLLQTLYHVGKIDTCCESESPLKWKFDLYDSNFLASISAILGKLERELHLSPSRSNAAMFLGEAAAFFSCWDDSLKNVSRRVAQAMVEWADGVNRQIDVADESVVNRLKGKQCTYLYQAILCLAKGHVDDDVLNLVIRITTKCYNLRMELKELSPRQANELRRCQSRCLEAMTSKIHQLLDAADNLPSLLTDALREVIQDAPLLTWHLFAVKGQEASTCFEAFGPDGCVYTINILTGAVLVNGSPPSILPSSIYQHSLYERTFGRSYFRVVLKFGVYQTTHYVNGRMYHFFLLGDDLHIAELDSKTDSRFELLDAEKSNIWGGELPVRLRKLHSHWFCRDTNCIALRGVQFDERELDFVLTCSGNSHIDSAAVWSCKCVPDNSRQKDLSDVLEQLDSFDELVKHESVVTKALARVENREFIHIVRRRCDVQFHLPRLRLSFSYKYGENEILSEDFPDFFLAKRQLLPILWGFRGYVTAERINSFQSKDNWIIFPEGRVYKKGRTVFVGQCSDCSAVQGWHRIHVHERLQHIYATDSVARFRLAALHTATHHAVPDRMTGMRGNERALELLRQCWTSVTLSQCERRALLNAISLSAGMFPNSYLLCLDVLQASEQTSFLSTSNEPLESRSLDKSDETTAYRHHFFHNWRSFLTEDEEVRILGHVVDRLEVGAHFSRRITGADCWFPVSEREVKHFETELTKALLSDKQSMEMDPFPLDFPESGARLELDILMELKSSWILHMDQNPVRFELCHDWSLKIDASHEEITSCRRNKKTCLLDALNANGDRFGSVDTDLVASLRLGNALPTATLTDLVRATYKPSLIALFNPCFSETGQKKLLQEIVLWLRLCVLEDKLTRMCACIKIGDIEALKVELCITRTFNGDEYPAWVAFEVESRLQIRPEQYLVAKHLLENPGDLIQLNMGSGKTRVILPMLALHLSLHQKDYNHITRLTILSALLKENYDFFRVQLTGSLAFLKVFMMPFRRDIELNDRRVEAMKRLAIQCRQERAVMMVAPEHRLSLELKLKEMSCFRTSRSDSVFRGLQYLCGGIWRDILDECDELLHHRFRLIYACGSVEELPAGAHRIHAVHACLNFFKFDKNVRRFFVNNGDYFVGSADFVQNEFDSEKFPAIRVSAQTAPESVLLAFRSVLANAMLTNPPHEFKWLQNHASAADITAAITDPRASTQWLTKLPDPYRNDVLALRGLLAGDILWHCLQKRHKVDFGIVRPGPKRICVPFRGADTPSVRSEFSHPEVAIILTTLAYYQDGLNREQVRQAFVELLKLGDAAKRSYYDTWLQLSRQRIRSEAPEKETAVNAGLDPSNPYQFDVLVEYFSSNMLTINFWLNTCVFPEEMQHHPQRLTANSWNLANNSSNEIIGFSGTNGNHRILPLQVKQHFKEDFEGLDSNEAKKWKEMMGTNGRMIDVILKHTIDCMELKFRKPVDSVLDQLAQGRNVLAIIDAGALLVGISNKDVATSILETLEARECGTSVDGVIFYENRPNEAEGWMIMECSGRVLRKDISPVAESRAFAFFDEPRCRGSDLKLAVDAVALLTLGPKMRKDVLMQAAGRMRKLGSNQKLILVGMSDVVHEIRCTTGLPTFNVKNILCWTIKNTVRMNEEGLMPWTSQGLFFASTLAKPELAKEDNDCTLQCLYGRPFAEEAFSSMALLAKERYVSRAGGQSALSLEQKQMIDKIMKCSSLYGTHFVCPVSGVNEECERELELQREAEEEVETEIPPMEALSEIDWNLSSVFISLSPKGLPTQAGVCSLATFVTDFLEPKTLSRIRWTGKVFGTKNFFQSVRDASGAAVESLNFYLRPVDVMLRFPSDEILLVSEREADTLLQLFWDRKKESNLSRRKGQRQVEFLHFGVVRAAADEKAASVTAADKSVAGLTLCSMALSLNGKVRPLPDVVLAELQLFAGETTFATDSRKQGLKSLLIGKRHSDDGEASGEPAGKRRKTLSACGEPEHLVEMRDMSRNFQFSDLEKICFEVALEAGEGFVMGGMRG